ncbi:MAG: helix-turn-helix domain-containing protein [Sphaerochaeta sp.]
MKKIALVLASIHTGSSVALWQEIALHAQRSADQLFVFPGGRIAYEENQEHLRNDIYSLVNPDTVEGMLIWASALSGAVSIEEVEEYLFKEDLPTVSIGVKVKVWPCVAFDAYAGMQAVMYHLVETHNVKRLAFLRGPEHHDSAQRRFDAYVDTLKHYNIDLDPKLITEPMGWGEGKKAVSQLLDERGLIPGKDFDTLVCSSDLMMFSAGKHLESLGYEAPRDYIITGFNDSRESRLLNVGCTTARMPVANLARISYSLLGRNLADGDSLSYDITLPCPLVIRRSCGCTFALGDEEHAKELLFDRAHFKSWIVEHLEVTEEEERLVDALFAGDLSVLSKFAHSYFDREGDPNLLTEAIHWYQELFAQGPIDSERFMSELVAAQDLVTHEHAYVRDRQEELLNNLKSDLLTVRQITALGGILAVHLPQLGIQSAYLVLYDEEGNPTLQGGYTEKGLICYQEAFSKRLILPPSYSAELGSGVFVILPLAGDNQSVGHLLVESTQFNSAILEDIRTSLSSAIKGARLVEQANATRDEAEKAERTQAEFFANISEALRSPLEKILEESSNEVIANHIHHLFNTIDLSLSYTPEFTLERRTFNLLEVLRNIKGITYRGSDSLPILLGDEQRLRQALEIFANAEELAVTSHLTMESVEVTFFTSREGSAQRDVAQRIIVLHDGRVRFDEGRVTISLNYPSLLGRAKSSAQSGAAYFLGDEEEHPPAAFSALGPIQLIRAAKIKSSDLDSLAGKLILWDGRRDEPALRRLLFQLAAHPILSRAPFSCINTPAGHETVAVSLAVSRPVVGSLIITADLAESFSFLHPIIVADEEALFRGVKEGPVGLLVASELDLETLTRLREKTAAPFVLLRSQWSFDEVEAFGRIPHVVLAHTSVVNNSHVIARLLALRSLGDVLPPLTGILVKKAIAYLGVNAKKPITRWQLAEAVHVSEDYLTRIFNKEIGISPWEYLNNHRIYLAKNLLKHSTRTIADIASECGYQDQAYFTRVFRKVTGKSPTMVRSE